MAMNTSISIKLLDGVTAPIQKISKAVQATSLAMDHAKLKIDPSAVGKATVFAHLVERIKEAFKSAGEAAEHYRHKAEHVFEKAEHIHQSGEAIEKFAEKAHEGVEKIVQPFELLEEAMARVKATTGATGHHFEELEHVARKVGSTGQASAVEAAHGLEQLHHAGGMNITTMGALTTSLDMAKVAQTSLSEAIAYSTDTAKIFGLTIDEDALRRVNDLSTSMALASGSSPAKFNEALLNAGGAAKEAGVSMERTAVFVGLLAQKGVQGTEAASALDMAFRLMKNPTSEATKLLHAMHVKTLETADGVTRLRDPIVMLTEFQKNMTAAHINGATQMGALAAMFPRGEVNIKKLLDAAKEPGLEKLNEALHETAGRVGEVANEMRENGIDETKKLNGELEELGNTVGETIAPVLKYFRDILTEVVHATTAWMKDHPALTKSLGLIAVTVALATSALAMMFTVVAAGVAARGMGILANAYGVKMPLAIMRGLIPAIGQAIIKLPVLAAEMWAAVAPALAAAAPFLAVAAAIGAVTLAVTQLVKAWDTLDMGESFKGMKDALGDGSFLNTMTLNPFSGLAPASPTGGAGPIAPAQAPHGLIELKIDSEGNASLKNPPKAKGMDLDVTAGLSMGHH